MLYLTRKIGQSIVINDNICITITQVKGNKSVKIGCDFPKNVTLVRKEIHDKISLENQIARNIDIEAMNKIINGEKY